MKKIALLTAAAIAGLMLTACGAASSPLPQAADTPAAEAPADTPAAEPAAPAASTCDVVREAFLTGTVKKQTSALKKLKADKTADAIAREYAGYWLIRDAKSKSLRELDQTLIVSACSF